MSSRILYLSIISLLILFSGCSDSSTNSTDQTEQQEEESSEDPVFKVTVDWDSLDDVSGQNKSTINSTKSISNSVTHFGARLVYVNENAVFSQSVEKSTAEEEGIITLDVPETEEAKLFAVAVKYEEYNEQVFLLGKIDDLSIEKGEEYNWTVDDFDWTETEWEVDEEYSSEYQNGEFTANKDDEDFRFPIHVTDYEEKLFGWNGKSVGTTEFSNGIKTVTVILDNPEVGTEQVSGHGPFYPYLDSELFSLPSGRYAVGERAEVDVSWE